MKALIARVRTIWSVLGVALLVLLASGESTYSLAAKPAPKRGLVIGKAGGPVYQAIQQRYRVTRGRGVEDPTRYDLVIFDGAHHTARDIHDNPAVRRFLAGGKTLVILNNTEEHRSEALRGIAWAHGEGSSPAVAFILQHDNKGVTQRLVQVDFPGPFLVKRVRRLAQSWLDLVQASAQGTNLGPASSSDGQTVVSFDEVTPITLTIPARIDTLKAPPGFSLSPAAPNINTTVSATFETLVYAMLEGSSAQNFQHKIFARQYLLASPTVLHDDKEASEVYTTYHSKLIPEVSSTLGFNDQFTLSLQIPAAVQNLLGVIENLPEAANNVTQLTTSKSQTESVGISASAGFQGTQATGSVGVSWSDSWSWGESSTVSLSDWSSQSNVTAGNVSYTFAATGGTPNTTDLVAKWNLQQWCQWIGNPGNLSLDDFNGLQSSAATNQSETVWATNSGVASLIPPQVVTLSSSAQVLSGEVFDYPYSGYCDLGTETVGAATTQSTIPLTIDLDFSWPALQPPAAAPWAVQFQQPVSNGNGQWSAPGTITLNSVQATDTTIPVSWVIQPQLAMLTLGNVCPGNTATFNPGTSVLTGAVTSVTIPAGQTQASLAPVFEPIGAPYNVQVVAWQPTGNLQAADCITVPAQAP